jgi:predicted kinase
VLLLDEACAPLIETARDVIWSHLAEGVFDPYILKAVFLAGGGGSGKGFISNVMFGTVKDMATTSFGIKSVNSDDMLRALAGGLDIQKRRVGKRFRVGGAQTGAHMVDLAPTGKAGLGGRTPMSLATQLGTHRVQRPGGMRDQAKQKIANRKELFVRGRLGLIIDGTAAKPAKLISQRSKLQEAGYDTYMVFVNTSLDVALQRNAARDRNVPEDLVRQAHARVQANLSTFKRTFGAKNFYEVNNSKHLSAREVIAKLSPKLHRAALKFLAAPLKNRKGWDWLRAETEGMPKSMLKKVTWVGKKRGK